MRRLNVVGLIGLLGTGCQRTTPEVAKPPSKPEVQDLGGGKSQLGTVTFKRCKIRSRDTRRFSSTNRRTGQKRHLQWCGTIFWEPLAEVKDLIVTYESFIEYEYGTDDERNTLYLTEDKKEVFPPVDGFGV